jgi:hypothetical protein
MNEWPDLLLYLRDTLEYEVEFLAEFLGFNIFKVDFSSWKLRLSNQTPVIWAKTSAIKGLTPKHILDSIQDVVREQGLGNQITIVLIEGKRSLLGKLATSPLDPIAVIGQDDVERIIHSNRPSGLLQDLIVDQLPISLLAPYETTAPVTGSRFFGRDPEVSRLINNSNTNYLVLGIRRIGKTSLVMEAMQRLMKKKDPPLALYLDCSDFNDTGDFVREVVRKLEPRELPRVDMHKYIFYFPNFLERMRQKYHRQLVFVLDEIDRLIASEKGDKEVFRMLRVAFNQGCCRFIFAGFRDALQEAHEITSPQYNFSQPLYLSEFSRQQAKDLILKPMESLRIHVNNSDDVVGRIYAETAGYPNLIQYYCMVLVRTVEQNEVREIGINSLIDVYNDTGFKNHLLSSFTQNTRNQEKAIVYALLKNSGKPWERGFTQEFIDASLRRQNIQLSLLEIDTACSVLKTAGFLQQVGREYFFASPVFVKILLDSYDPVYSLRKVKEEGL